MKGIAGIWKAFIGSLKKTKPEVSTTDNNNRHHATPPWENHLASEKLRLFDEGNVREGRARTADVSFSVG